MPTGQRSAVDKALDLVEIVSRADKPLRLSELANLADMHRATAYRVLVDLVRRGWVMRVDDRYLPGPVVLQLSNAGASNSLVGLAHPVLQDLSEQTGMMVNLQVLEADRTRVVDVVRPERLAIISDLLGEALPLHKFAGPIALVSALDESARRPYLALAERDNYPLDGPTGLLSDLHRAGETGFALERGRNQKIIASLSRAVLSAGGHPVCAVTVVGLDAEYDDLRVAELQEQLAGATDEVHRRLTASGNTAGQPS